MAKTTTTAIKSANRERASTLKSNPNRTRSKEAQPSTIYIGRSALKSVIEGVGWSVRNPKKSVPALLAASVISYGLVPSSHDAPKDDTCTDASHVLVESHDGLFSSAMTVGDIAHTQSQKRHYLMTPQGIKEANAGQDLLRTDDKGKLTDDLKDGLHCVDLPEPIVSGFALTTAHETVGDIAGENAISPDQFLQFNPQFTGKETSYTLPEGIEVKVREAYDPSFVLVPSAPGDIQTMAGTDVTERNAYLAANGAALGAGHSVTKGDEAYIRTPQQATAYVTAFDKEGVYKDYVAQHMPASAETAATAEGTLAPGFIQHYIDSVRAEEAAWAQHPDPTKYMPGETNLDQNWCSFFVLYNLNQSGANLQKWEHVGDTRYYLPRVSDMWNYMTNAHNPNFYSYDFHALRDGKAQPRAGDVIFFNWKDSWEKFQASIQNHVGTVVDYNADTRTITTIEGNAGNNGDIETKTYQIDDPRIMGISRPLEQRPQAITVSEKPDVLPPAPELDEEQQSIAHQIITIGHQRGFSDRDIVTAINVALQESNMHNPQGGDRDSGGIFQQRPSVLNHDGTPYWGTKEQVTNPTYAINRFFDELAKEKERAQEPMLKVALDVQDPSRAAYESPTHNFTQREPIAWSIFTKESGSGV